MQSCHRCLLKASEEMTAINWKRKDSKTSNVKDRKITLRMRSASGELNNINASDLKRMRTTTWEAKRFAFGRKIYLNVQEETVGRTTLQSELKEKSPHY
ncbi:hypothetical protein CEXT_429191 [Caerostris extrusa]|uniref:Uncharacterized protein n=1 Tax=Caerostris extrusa TaxID=172846 RepID=A0AAV4MU20_CAEEX|nr:hypothetical protein CEXT_429191 [Caerostris extrusa]